MSPAHDKVRIKFADECPPCPCCGEPFCSEHQEHYAECPCVGPHRAEELGYRIVEEDGVLYGVRQTEGPVTGS